MIRRLDLPDSPEADADARMSAPSALRNRDAILSELRRLAPPSGRALELASGTGEHVIAFARALPDLTWQPTDPDPVRRASIAAWALLHPAQNLLAPRALDAARTGWGTEEGPVDLIVLVNLLHLISDAEARIVLAEMAAALAPGGRALIYGPFLRDGQPTSDGDAAFHDSLRAQDPAIGYKDLADVSACLRDAHLDLAETVAMPANNLMLVADRPQS